VKIEYQKYSLDASDSVMMEFWGDDVLLSIKAGVYNQSVLDLMRNRTFVIFEYNMVQGRVFYKRNLKKKRDTDFYLSLARIMKLIRRV